MMSLLIFSDKLSVAFGLGDAMTQYVTLPILCFVVIDKPPFLSVVSVSDFMSNIKKAPTHISMRGGLSDMIEGLKFMRHAHSAAL